MGYVLAFLHQARVVVGHFLSGAQYLRQVYGHHRDAVALKQLLAGAAGVESQRTGAYLPDAAVAKTVHHTADGGETAQVLGQQLTVDGIGVESGVGEGNAVLVEIVAYRYLAAESVTPAVKVHLVVLVVTGLHQYGHAEVGIGDGIDDADFKTEIGQRHDDAVYLFAVLAELTRHLQTVLAGLDAAAARGRGVLRQYHIGVALVLDGLEQLLAHIAG